MSLSTQEDAYATYIRHKRQREANDEPDKKQEHFIAHVVLCMTAACLACIPVVGWIPAAILWWIDAKWCNVIEGTYNGGGPIPVRIVE